MKLMQELLSRSTVAESEDDAKKSVSGRWPHLEGSDLEGAVKEFTRLTKAGWTKLEAFMYIGQMEEVNPDIDEDRALAKMKKISDDVKARLTSIKEAAEDDSEETNEKVIAKADEFRVVLNTDSEQVDILDGEETVRLSMPLVVWKQLTRQ